MKNGKFELLIGEEYIPAYEYKRRLALSREARLLIVANGLLRDMASVLASEIKNGALKQARGSFTLELLAERIDGIQKFLAQQKPGA